MKARHIAILTTALAAAVTVTVTAPIASAAAAAPAAASHVRVHPDSFTGYEEGYGATLAAATTDARHQMNGDYWGCQQPYIVTASGQYSDGTWWVDMIANGCQGYN